jgi:transcriptional regulator with XRE-family HTH domain
MSSPRDIPTTRLRFARNLRQLRLMRGLSQEELAARAELSQTFLSQIETGRRNVSLDSVDRLAQMLQVDVMEFFQP